VLLMPGRVKEFEFFHALIIAGVRSLVGLVNC